jgi:hypothetical protein
MTQDIQKNVGHYTKKCHGLSSHHFKRIKVSTFKLGEHAVA